MQHHRNQARAEAAPPPHTTAVIGLGVCDVLRVELQPRQLPSLDEEIQIQRAVYDQSIAGAAEDGDRDAFDRLRAERRTLTMVAEQIRRPGDSPVIWGPAAAISDLVTCSARSAADRLVDAMQRDLLVDGGDGPALIEAAHVAAAWAETYVALRAVESFSVDPDNDHVRP